MLNQFLIDSQPSFPPAQTTDYGRAFPPAQTTDNGHASYVHTTHRNSVVSGAQDLTMLSSSHPRNVTVKKGVGRYRGGGVLGPQSTHSAQSLDGLTDRSLGSRDILPAYSS